jgi:adenylosuccinate synthase
MPSFVLIRCIFPLRAYIVVDLGFGDSGKGILTDFLARHLDAGVVVRYNGGAQAGHNVIAPDRRQHTFSQFGSGTFIAGVKTYLSKYVVIHPGALLVEGDILVGMGVRDAFSRIRLSDQAIIITPFHQAANHIREIARGENRHGSCGVGVGEAVEDSLSNVEDCVLAGDLINPPKLRQKLRSIREHKREQLRELYKDKLPGEALAREWEIFEREDVIDSWISAIARIGELGLVVSDSVLQRWLHQTEAVIFEGAQGVLLDAESGFHPYTTWSRCTAANAYDLIREMASDSHAFQIGVMRSYAVRHGPGPLPTETDVLTSIVSEHNNYNEWQGAVRYGWFDAVLARYALDVTGGVDSLVVTHLDILSHLKRWIYCAGYRVPLDFDHTFIDAAISNGVLKNFHLPPFLTLAQREKLTQALSTVTPVLETCDTGEGKVIQKIESLIGQPIGIISRGPSAENVKVTNSIPS